MNLIAIDTSTDWCGISLFENDECIRSFQEHIPRKHSEVLPEFFQSIMKESSFKKNDLDAVAVSIGPGSFTGLRIGLGFAKGLAYALSKPVVPVPTLQVIANDPIVDFEDFIALLYSHRNIVYFQKFNNKKPESEPVASIFSDIDLDNNIIQYGCEKLLVSRIFSTAKPSAEAVGCLALSNFNNWKIEKPHTLTSNYISPFEVG